VAAVYTVALGVALRRPPRIDEFRKVTVTANGPADAQLIAAQISSCTCAMVVWAGTPDDVPDVNRSLMRSETQ
jgi:hypothetical protein